MVWQFLMSALAGGVLTTALLGIVGVLARSQLAHWLNKDIEKVKAKYQRELESDRANFQRELETYKVSLIAQAERAKSAQDVKRASALKILEMEFQALQVLHHASRGFGVDLCTGAELATVHRSHAQFSKLDTGYEALCKAFLGIEVFLDAESKRMHDRYRNASLNMLYPHCRTSATPLQGDQLAELAHELFNSENDVDAWIKRRLVELRSLE